MNDSHLPLHKCSSRVKLTLLKNLLRYPLIKNDPLQAWDSADELLIEHLASLDLSQKKILIIEDHFGALSTSLASHHPVVFSDSYISHQAILQNSSGKITSLHQLKDLSGEYDLILIRITKNLSYFEDLLANLSQHLLPHAKVICAAMVKHLAKGCFPLLEKYIGPTTTSLAVKKARLIFADFVREKVKSAFPLSVKIENFITPFVHHSNIFSLEKLDIGTRFFLEHIPTGSFESILDLGCGNGIVGIKAKQKNKNAKLIFCDESAMALESAKTNYKNYFQEEAQFEWTHGCESITPESVDLVLCNPPFHQHHSVGDFIALQFFHQAKRVLKKGGCLRVIGNAHLGYEGKLKAIFGKSTLVASNAKFVIIDCFKN